jgi:hypothetical protein
MKTASELEARFEATVVADPREAAEIAYAIASLKRQEGDLAGAGQYARRAIDLFRSVPTDTLEDCAARNTVVEGIVIPDIIHEDVVKERFKDLL